MKSFIRLFLFLSVGMTAANSFADSNSCYIKVRTVAAAMSGIPVAKFSAAELSAGSYTVWAGTGEPTYVISTDESCDVYKACKGSAANGEVCDN